MPMTQTQMHATGRGCIKVAANGVTAPGLTVLKGPQSVWTDKYLCAVWNYNLLNPAEMLQQKQIWKSYLV